MRIIHTADWHIGQSFYGYDRADEHIAAIAAIRDIAVDKKPDVLLISGDIYHNPQPSAASQALLTKAITEILAAVPNVTIVMTAGNHDSASRHEVFSDAWRCLGVHAIGSIASDDSDNFDKLIIELPSGFIVAVPYVYGRAIDDGLFPRLLEEVGKRNTRHLPVVAMAHVMMAFAWMTPDADFKGAEEPKDLELFGTGYDYLALGHVHHPVGMPGTEERVRYSGSLIPVSFAEDFRHTVSLVDIDDGKVSVEQIPLPELRRVVSIPAGGFKPWQESLNELKKYSSAREDYIRLCINRDGEVPSDAAETAQKICQEKGLRFCLLHYPPVGYATSGGDVNGLSFDEFREMSPSEVAELYIRDHGIVLSDSVKSLFNEIVESVKKESEDI